MSSGVEFEEDGFSYKRPQAPGGSFNTPNSSYPSPNQYGNSSYSGQEATGLAGFLMRHGLAKTPQAAQYIMIGIMVFNIIITIIVIKYIL